MVLGNLAVAPDFRPDFRLVENLRNIDTLGFPVVDRLFRLQHIRPAHHLIDGAEAEFCHDFPQFLDDERHKVDRVLGIAREVFPQVGVLGGNADGAGVFVAHPHHDAAEGHQRRGGKTVFFRAQESSDRYIPSGLHLPVGLHGDAAPQIVQHQGLVSFREAQFPGESRVLDGGLGRCAGAAIKPGDQHDIGVGLGDSSGDRADADLGYQLDADPRFPVGILQVVDQLRQVFNGVDVVAGRRRNQAHTRGGVAHLAIQGYTLRPGSWPPSPGFAPWAILI